MCFRNRNQFRTCDEMWRERQLLEIGAQHNDIKNDIRVAGEEQSSNRIAFGDCQHAFGLLRQTDTQSLYQCAVMENIIQEQHRNIVALQKIK